MDPYSRSHYDQGLDSKIVVMGNSGVGKTSLLQRYTQNKFDPKNMTSTSGAFFVTKKAYVNGLKVRLQLWDTAGQERFRSMAPMYYRGANAALLLYDITNASTFEDVRGWLEELRKNCAPDLIIYIVGAKADLHRHRQVTSDFARVSLHRWFPPPSIPEPTPLPEPSTLSYIRPRFTSFPSLSVRRSPPNSPIEPSEEQASAYLDIPSRTGASRSKSVVASPRQRQPPLARAKTTATSADRAPRYRSRPNGGWNEIADDASNSLNEEDEDEDDDSPEWGLERGMELFEVSAATDQGINDLFDHLISSIIARKDRIEHENEEKKRDSVMLSSPPTPTWSAQAEREEALEKKRRSTGWSCC